MKYFVMLTVLLASGAAHAELLVAKGSKGTLKVEYEYSAIGNSVSTSKDQNKDWTVSRTISLTASMTADAAQPIAVMRKADAAQMPEMKGKEALANGTAQKMAPMMMDMEAIAAKCKDNEACLEREVSKYASSMQMTPELKSAGNDIIALSKQGAARYQLWRSTSQSGSYSIDELYHRQVFEMTCTNKPGQTCKSEETHKGGGEIPVPVGKSTANASLLEVDAVKKELVVQLPVPLAALGYTRALTTSIPGEKSATSQSALPNIFRDVKLITVVIPGDLQSLSGTQTIRLNGTEGEGGTLHVKWRFSVP